MAERVVKVRLTAQIAEYATAMTEAANKTRAVGTEAERAAQKREAFQTLGTAAVVVGGAMTALTLAVAKTGIEYNTLQQASRAALSTLLGGAEQANAQMDKLDEFARSSPFAKTTFIQAQQQMLAFGVEAQKVIPYLDAIQDAVAAAGGSSQQLGEIAFVMSQISAAGKITGQDLIQFGQRGINAAELIGMAMGKTGAEIKAEITAGTLGADEALDALAEGMKSKFDGAAANVKDTFAGAMDRVQAAWRDLSADLMKPLVDPSGGGALVGFLNWLADVMRAFEALPEPIKLTGGAMFALAGFVTLASGTILAATPRIVAMKIAFMELSATMRGIGLAGGAAVLALTAVVTVLGAVAASQAAAQQRAEAYASALRQGTKATDEYVAAQLAASDSYLWFDMGSAISNAKELGITVEELTDAVNGSDAEFEAFRKRVEETGNNSGIASGKMNQLVGKVDELRAAHDAAVIQLRNTDEAQAALTNATVDGADAAGSAADAYLAEAEAVEGLTSQLSDLIGKINEANGVNQDAVSSNARYQDALAGISEEVQRQRDAYEQANETLDGFVLSLDENTASGSANASMLANVAGAAQNAAEKQFEVDKTTMSAKDAADKYLATLAAQRQAFIDSATEAGFNADQVQALADKVFALPGEKEIQILAETAGAQEAIDRLVIDNDGKRITITADVNYQSPRGITVTPNAEGGLYEKGVKAFAGGGFEPGIYPRVSGGIHKFAEEYAEGYVSMDPARRGRSEGVWRAIGSRMGFTPPAVAPAASPNFNVVVSSKGGVDLLQYVDVRIEQANDGLGSTLRGS